MAITPLQKTRELYSDFDMDLTRHPVTNDVSRKTNENAVKDSIKNIILTDFGERPFQPNFGGNIRAQLFESHTPLTLKAIKTNIETALAKFEPRAEIIGVVVDSDPDSNTVKAYIEFITINSEVSTTLEILLKRVR